jgi:glyoxylase-like metal-dependent hydrolase (beta-lactamase superfamily II)
MIGLVGFLAGRWSLSSGTRRIAPGLTMLTKSWGCNIYVIDRGRPALVDAGFPLDSRATRRCVQALAPGGPVTTIATHCHLDHMGSMARLRSEFDTRVAAHSLDAPVMEGETPYPRFKLDPIRALYYRALGPLYPYEHVEVDDPLEDGDVIDVLGGLRVVHVPGHTDGSIALYQEERRMLFTGDTLRNEGGVLEGPPPRFTPDLELAYEGISRKIMGLDFEVLLPGHGEPVMRGARERVRQMLQERERNRDE